MRRVNLIPMAGAGQRFVDGGYDTPKPLIEVDELPMIVQAANSLPVADHWIFICRKEHVLKYEIDKLLKKYFTNLDIISIWDGANVNTQKSHIEMCCQTKSLNITKIHKNNISK